MQLKAGIAHPRAVQAPLDHLKRGHLLGHEQHAAPVGDRGRDDVGDRPRLAGAGRPLDDEVAAAPHLVHRHRLRTVAIDDVELLGRPDMRVNRGVLTDEVVGWRETIGQQRADRRSVREAGARRPVSRVEVAVHQELREGEEPEHDVVGQDFPARLQSDGLRHVGGVGRWVELLAKLHPGQADRMNALEIGFEREVRGLLFAPPAQAEAFGGRPALKPDRQQGQRRVPDVGCVVGIDPLQRAEREVEDINTLLLLERTRIDVEVEQALLQPF